MLLQSYRLFGKVQAQKHAKLQLWLRWVVGQFIFADEIDLAASAESIGKDYDVDAGRSVPGRWSEQSLKPSLSSSSPNRLGPRFIPGLLYRKPILV
jgi:hypothetical protein